LDYAKRAGVRLLPSPFPFRAARFSDRQHQRPQNLSGAWRSVYTGTVAFRTGRL